MSEHTPTPWVFDGNCAGYIRENEEAIARAYSLDDAAFIVRAVNSHEALVKALEAIRDWPEPLLATTADAMREVARAALAASKGDDR